MPRAIERASCHTRPSNDDAYRYIRFAQGHSSLVSVPGSGQGWVSAESVPLAFVPLGEAPRGRSYIASDAQSPHHVQSSRTHHPCKMYGLHDCMDEYKEYSYVLLALSLSLDVPYAGMPRVHLVVLSLANHWICLFLFEFTSPGIKNVFYLTLSWHMIQLASIVS